MSDNLVRSLSRHAIDMPGRPALRVGGGETGYGDLARLGRTIAGWLLAAGHGRAGRVGVLGARSLATYAGVVGACWAGGTYVPLGSGWPAARLVATLGAVRLDALIVDAAGATLLSPLVLAACPRAILVAEPAPDGAQPDLPCLDGLADPSDLAPVPLPDEHIAYIIFTSGTTGRPKGVEVSLGAIAWHLAVIQEIYRFTAADRISLAPDLTFDPSILNMFMTWNVGATLHVVPAERIFAPVGFIQAHALTVWNSGPTTIGLAMRLGLLLPGALPTLRISIFGGETLTLAAAAAWQRAAPGSIIDNVYGPAEATIECLYQRLTDPPVVTPGRGSLAIGLPYRGTGAAILGPDRRFLPAGEVGELAVSGPQLAKGYLDQPALTAARFPEIGGTRWYLTGDLALRDAEGRFHHLGRTDDQVKVRGLRVEPGDIETHLRRVCGTEQVAVVAWPFADGSAIGLVGFVAGTAGEALPSQGEILAGLKRLLPHHMVPQSIRRIETLPVTPHGKIDRAALIALLAAEPG